MYKKVLGMLLIGASFLVCSCIDDTYDLANKEVSTDMQIKGNKLSLPLGSLCPMPLDSLLVDSMLESIPFLKVDEETRAYSLSLNDSLKTGIDKENLEALKNVSELSADIDPISIPIEEISFDPEAYSLSKELDFGEVNLSKITLNEIKPDPITLELDELTLEPIEIDVKPESPIKFNIPKVELEPIEIAGVSQTATFNIDDINLEEGTTIDIETQQIELDVPKFDMPKITPPSFSATHNVSLSAPEIDNAIKGFTTLGLGTVPKDVEIPNISINETNPHTVNIEFGYKLPQGIEEIKDLTKIVFDKESSKVNFKLTNPEILRSQTGLNRTINFTIKFPENYKLAIDEEADRNKYQYQWDSSIPNELSAKITPADEKTTEISFYLTEIGLDFNPDHPEIQINNQATCTLNYVVSGDILITKGTPIADIKDGLKYNLGLDVAFAMAEVWGSTNPVSTENSINQELDFSFELNNLDYIKSIDKIVLNPQESKLCFSMGIDNGFGAFDIAEESKIVLSLPEEFIFAEEGMVLPKDPQTNKALVVYNKEANEFEISSLKVFESGQEWVLPISGVDFKGQGVVEDGTFSFSRTAVVKAVTGTEEVLTIGGIDNIDLVNQTEILFQKHQITMSASPVTLVVTDVEGSTAPIDLTFNRKTFNFSFDMTGKLEDIASINYVKFDTEAPLTITSSIQGFGGIEFANGSRIALRFPEEFIFDTEKSTLYYDDQLKAFVIEDFSELVNGKWTFALQEVQFASQIGEEGFSIDASVTMEAINDEGTSNTLYVGFADKFSLDKMREQKLFGEKTLNIALNDSEIKIKDIEVASKDIDVDFKTLEVTYPINIDNLSYITKIGSIDLNEANNSLNFHSEIKGEDGKKKGLGRFDLAENSVIYLNFPAKFKLDMGCSLPGGAEFIDSSTIRITSLSTLDSQDWELKVKRIAIDTEISDYKFEDEYTISVVGYDANRKEGALTIAAIENLTFNEIQSLGGECNMDISVNGKFKIADVEVSIENIGIDFEEQSFVTRIPTIENLDLIKEIKYISFEENKNTVNLNISLDGNLGDFDLVDSKVKLSLPSEFELDIKQCNFNDFEGGLEYNETESAIYINSIQSIINRPIQLAIKQININQTIEDNQFNWEVNFSVAAVTNSNEPNKLYVGCKDNNLRFTEVSPIMGDKVIQILVEEAELGIDEAVIVSNGVTENIEEKVDISLKETITEAIDRVDFIGFAQPVPMTLSISTKGLESLDVPVKILADITFPPVFDISSDDDNITITDQGLHIDTEHSFKENQKIELKLLVNNLDFTTLEGGCLALTPNGNGGRVLEYTGSAAINGSVSIADATVSSDILEGISMDINFDMGKVVLKDFSGLYSGTIEPIIQNFELGMENGFDELKENGITLTNTKPELMISIYNPIGVPVDVALSIVGKDKDGNEISASVIAPKETLRIEPAKFNEQGELVADTTRWLFTSNEGAEVPAGYKPVFIENLASLLDELPYSIDFSLVPTIVTENVTHHVDLTKLELGGSYAISVPFDLQFEQSVPLDFGEEVNSILRNGDNTLTLANPQLALSIHNPIADSLVFGLSIIGKDANGQPLETFTIDFIDEPFVLKAGVRNEADGTITPTATRWLFAVSEDIQREGFETKVAPALGSLLANIPHDIDIALNAHFNTNLTQQIDYNNDLELKCEYGISVPLQFDNLHLSYADTISEIQFNLQESLEEMNISISNVELAIAMNLKNTLPLGLKLNLIPLDARNNIIKGIEIGSIEVPAGNGADINSSKNVTGTPVELSIKCDSPNTLSNLDKIAFSIEVESGNENNALSGKQGLQVCDIVLQVMCDIEI